MRKMLTAALLMCTIALLSTLSMATVSAKPMKPLRCELEITVVWAPLSWVGTVTGDIVGALTLNESGASFPGVTEHFLETFTIETADGGLIKGFDEGVWIFKNLKWISNGRVTFASGSWAYLLGCKVYFIGTTSEFLGPGNPLTGVGTMTIVPGSHG